MTAWQSTEIVGPRAIAGPFSLWDRARSYRGKPAKRGAICGAALRRTGEAPVPTCVVIISIVGRYPAFRAIAVECHPERSVSFAKRSHTQSRDPGLPRLATVVGILEDCRPRRTQGPSTPQSDSYCESRCSV